MSVFNMLKEDHKKVAKLLEEGNESTERAVKTRAHLLEKITQELNLHTKLEEATFYPPLKKYEETKDLILEAYEEHALVKKILHELQNVFPEDDTWGAKFKVLKENVEHHVDEEEKELFPKVKKVLTHEDLDSIEKAMIEFKERHK